MIEDGAAVLGAGVATLTILGRRIVHFIKEFEEGGVRELRWVEGHLEGFSVWAKVSRSQLLMAILEIREKTEIGLVGGGIITYDPSAQNTQLDS